MPRAPFWFPRGPSQAGSSALHPLTAEAAAGRPSISPEPLALLVNVRLQDTALLTGTRHRCQVPGARLGTEQTDWMHKDGEQRAGNTRDQVGLEQWARGGVSSLLPPEPLGGWQAVYPPALLRTASARYQILLTCTLSQ